MDGSVQTEVREAGMRPAPIPLEETESGAVSPYTLAARKPRRAFGNFVSAAEKLLLQRMLESVGNPPLVIVLWNGEAISNHGGSPAARILIHDRGALLKLITNPELCFGEMYAAHRIDVEGDMMEFLDAVYRHWPRVTQAGARERLLAPFREACRNSLQGARHNIHHHYDIGNDFYRLWLDERMVYTCAYFPDQAMSLEDAQLAKLDHVCRKLWLKPGEQVVEAGCGWGALALHMARNYGVKVKAYNISREQIAFARERAQAEGLAAQVEFIEDDYRNIHGQFDAFVSVGMLEHVGADNYRELGKVIDRSLKDEGRGLIHSIGRDYPRPMDAWIAQHIFPGACPPSLGQMMQIFEPYEFSLLDVENLRLHYAKTLEHWLQRFELATGHVAAMFDAAFVRTWRLYLTGSLTAFRTGDMQLFQVLFNRSGRNGIPWTREYQYPVRGSNGQL